MKTGTFLRALEYLDDEYLTELDEIIKENDMYNKKNAKRSYKAVLSLAAAVALILALGITAYAFDLFGFKALLRQQAVPDFYEGQAPISLTQPQAVPEGLDAAIDERVSNSRAAWAEWQEWLEANPGQTINDELPEVFRISASSYAVLLNEDGSATIRVMSGEDEDGDGLLDVIEERHATAEDYAV